MTLITQLSNIFGQAFAAQNIAASFGAIIVADRPDLAEFQCNGALQAAKAAKANPRSTAESVVAWLQASAHAPIFAELSIAGPGFINIKLADNFVGQALQGLVRDSRYGCELTPTPRKIVIDFCGLNVAKRGHIGHLRPTIIGDALQRILRFGGHDVTSDIHLGDWGLPIGMLLASFEETNPDWAFFKTGATVFPTKLPVTFDDLSVLYPQASQRAKTDEVFRQKCRETTAALQEGHRGYRALWQYMLDISVTDIREKTDRLGVNFDLWYGESDADPYTKKMVAELQANGLAILSDGAWVVPISQDNDKFTVPPLMLVKSDGGVTYGTTDVATIMQRMHDFKPNQILYVVDQRQALHFEQVFRTVRKAGYVADNTQLTHIGFGTMNGLDGKPFKTRDGSVMSFDELLVMVVEKAKQRLIDIGLDQKLCAATFEKTADMVGFAALKFGDLQNAPRNDYIFDLEKFVSFEGKTGPYLQYTTVRLKALLAKAIAQNLAPGALQIDATQKELAVLLLQFPHAVQMALNDYAPNVLADYCFRLAQLANRFYQATPVLAESDKGKQASYLALFDATQKVLTRGLDLLGIAVPEVM
jgi:arginyl-tRNA synthetase